MCGGDERSSPVVYARTFFLLTDEGEKVALEAGFIEDAIEEVRGKGLHGILYAEVAHL